MELTYKESNSSMSKLSSSFQDSKKEKNMKEYNTNHTSCFLNISFPQTFARGHASQDSTKEHYYQVIDKFASMNKTFIPNFNQDQQICPGELLNNSSLLVQNWSGDSFRINECIKNLSSPSEGSGNHVKKLPQIYFQVRIYEP